SWSVLSGAGEVQHTQQAMASLYSHLVKTNTMGASLVLLLNPPFDDTSLNPGYIKGYLPGVRENGGQYTHAAIWAAMAFAKMGDSARAFELLQMINPLNHARNIEEA